MRQYSIVKSTLWTGDTGREWSRLGRDYQVLGVYLQTSPYANQDGLYYLPLAAMYAEVNIEPHAARDVFQVFEREQYAFLDPLTQWVWVVSMAHKQLLPTGGLLQEADHRVKGVQRWYATLPVNPWTGPFFDHYHALFHLPERRAPNAPPLPPRQASAVAALATVEPSHELFEEWWRAYPKKTGKRAAWVEWKQIQPLPDDAFLERALATLAWQRRSPKWLEDNGRYIPDPERYLAKGHYLNEQATGPSVTGDEAQTLSTLAKWVAKGG